MVHNDISVTLGYLNFIYKLIINTSLLNLKVTNITKVEQTLQRPDESLSAFQLWLCEVYCIYTSFDPEVPKNQRIVNIHFVRQSARNIHQKLKKLEGFTVMKIS